VTDYLVELYIARTDAAGAKRAAGRMADAAAEQTRHGVPTRLVRSIFVPVDETCFMHVEAGSPDAVRDAVRLAAVPCERIAEAIATEATT